MIGNILWIVFWGVITFSLLVVLHEAGHFVAARAFGLKVHEFMVGLPGPRISYHGKKTTFGVTAIPFGGYVRIAGMEPGEMDEYTSAALAHATRVRRTDALETSKALGITQDRSGQILATLADWGALTPAEDDDVSYDAVYPADDADDPQTLLDTALARDLPRSADVEAYRHPLGRRGRQPRHRHPRLHDRAHRLGLLPAVPHARRYRAWLRQQTSPVFRLATRSPRSMTRPSMTG